MSAWKMAAKSESEISFWTALCHLTSDSWLTSATGVYQTTLCGYPLPILTDISAFSEAQLADTPLPNQLHWAFTPDQLLRTTPARW